MSATLVPVAYHCNSCHKFFQEGFEFPEKYQCEEDSEYWEKEEGRNCPTCHKFGRNTDGPICPDCNEEVEEVFKSVNPDEEDVRDSDGNEIVTKKKKTSKEKQAEEREATDKARTERYEKEKAIFDREIQKHKLSDAVGTFRDDAIVAIRHIKAVDSNVSIYAAASISSSWWHDGDGNRYEVEFRIVSGGYKGKHRHDGGFCFHVGDTKDFDNLDNLVAYAKERIADVGE